MQPVYIQRIASIHPPKDHSPGNNRPYLQACEPDYKDYHQCALAQTHEPYRKNGGGLRIGMYG